MMPPPTPVSALRVLVRGLRCRCPVCGTGRVFVRGVVSAGSCGDCGWRLERCVGHWIGGNEVNVLATFTAGVAMYVLCLPAFGVTGVSVGIATAFTGVFAVAFYRPSRGLFFSLDYLLDPTPDTSPAPPPDGTDRRPGRDLLSPWPPRGPAGGPSRAASRLTRKRRAAARADGVTSRPGVAAVGVATRRTGEDIVARGGRHPDVVVIGGTASRPSLSSETV